MRRAFLIAVLAIPLLLAGADYAVWRVAIGRLQDGFAAFAAARRAAGWVVAAGTPVPGGWPMEATLTVPHLSLSGATATIPGGLAWTAERAVLRLSPRHRSELSVEAEGEQRLRLSTLPELAFAAARMRATIPLVHGEAMPEARIVASGLRGGGTNAVTIAAARAEVALAPQAGRNQPALSLKVRSQRIGLPEGRVWPLGREIGAVDLNVVLDGPAPSGAEPAAQAGSWREGGGKAELQVVGMRWGPLGAAGSAVLTLDGALQPAGVATLRLTGHAQALDALAKAGVIGRHAAAPIEAILGLLAGPAEAGRAPEVEVPLTLQDRVLSMGRIPLARVPALAWPT